MQLRVKIVVFVQLVSKVGFVQFTLNSNQEKLHRLSGMPNLQGDCTGKASWLVASGHWKGASSGAWTTFSFDLKDASKISNSGSSSVPFRHTLIICRSHLQGFQPNEKRKFGMPSQWLRELCPVQEIMHQETACNYPLILAFNILQ